MIVLFSGQNLDLHGIGLAQGEFVIVTQKHTDGPFRILHYDLRRDVYTCERIGLLGRLWRRGPRWAWYWLRYWQGVR